MNNETNGYREGEKYFSSQQNNLLLGINEFEPCINDLHNSYKNQDFIDWPTVILATMLQVTVISLFKLLPSDKSNEEPLDKRSIATIVRNIVDTHDALDMFVNTESEEEYNLHRDIMGLYLSGKINKIQEKISPTEVEEHYKHSKSFYWKKIKQSKLYNKSMKRLKSGNTFFYKSRRKRVEKVCGNDTDFVLGILADLSAYVHSVPPSIWLSKIDDTFSNNDNNKGTVAVWLRLGNFYYARSIDLILEIQNKKASDKLMEFLNHHNSVFSK
jgi:hypothetical protein